MEIAIHSRRQMISGLALALFSGLVLLGANSAIARNGGPGGANGEGRDGSNRGGGSENSGRSSGAGGGNVGRDRANDGFGYRSSDAPAETKAKKSRSLNETVRSDDRSIRVRHGSGIAEEVNDRGRYVMRDRSGRTIVNRTATKSDLDRLRSLTK